MRVLEMIDNNLEAKPHIKREKLVQLTTRRASTGIIILEHDAVRSAAICVDEMTEHGRHCYWRRCRF